MVEGAGEAPPDAGRVSGPAGGRSLPCHSSNNSDKTPSKLTAYQRKNAFILKENVAAMVHVYGLEKVGFLTLTFPRKLTLSEANRRLNNLGRRVLPELFVDWITVREFTPGRGRAHFHLLVAAKEDIRTGFDFESYLAMLQLSKLPKTPGRMADLRHYSRNLKPNDFLRRCWSTLRSVLPRYQFGRHELIPIRTNQEAIAHYVGGYIRKSLDSRPDEAKGCRLVTYSKGFPRRVTGHQFQWNCPSTALWRAKLAIFARLHGIDDFDDLSATFGPRWAWWFRDIILSLNVIEKQAEIGGFSDLEDPRFSINLESDPSFLARGPLSLYQPTPPLDDDGNPFPAPRELRRVFQFHAMNWNKSKQELLERADRFRRIKSIVRSTDSDAQATTLQR